MNIDVTKKKAEGKRPFAQSRNKSQDKMKIDWLHLVQNRICRGAVVSTTMNLLVPLKVMIP